VLTEYFNCFGTSEIESRIAMAKAEFKRRKILFSTK
jgi:uncharacterized small protein (DUF1192 family)